MVKTTVQANGKIKNRMKVLLAERDMSIHNLAELTECHYTTIYRFCTRTRDGINLEIMTKVCEVLEVQPGDIFVYVGD